MPHLPNGGGTTVVGNEGGVVRGDVVGGDVMGSMGGVEETTEVVV